MVWRSTREEDERVEKEIEKIRKRALRAERSMLPTKHMFEPTSKPQLTDMTSWKSKHSLRCKIRRCTYYDHMASDVSIVKSQRNVQQQQQQRWRAKLICSNTAKPKDRSTILCLGASVPEKAQPVSCPGASVPDKAQCSTYQQQSLPEMMKKAQRLSLREAVRKARSKKMRETIERLDNVYRRQARDRHCNPLSTIPDLTLKVYVRERKVRDRQSITVTL